MARTRGRVMKLIVSTLFLLGIAANSYAGDTMVTLVNHYNKDITFDITKNQDVARDWPVHFRLYPGDQVSSAIVEIPEAIYVSGMDNGGGRAFFAIEKVQGKVIIHGYMSEKIAFDWDDNQPDKIIFCTPEQYQKKHQHC